MYTVTPRLPQAYTLQYTYSTYENPSYEQIWLARGLVKATYLPSAIWAAYSIAPIKSITFGGITRLRRRSIISGSSRAF